MAEEEDQGEEAQQVTFSSMPSSIWALKEEHRGFAVAAAFRHHALRYKELIADKDRRQNAIIEALSAVQVIQGLFEDTGDPARVLLEDLLDLLLAVSNGRSDARLQSTRNANLSSGRGLGSFAHLKRHAFCIAAFQTLRLVSFGDQSLSDLQIRLWIAEAMGLAGLVSPRKGRDGIPLKISEGGVRQSLEKSDTPILLTSAHMAHHIQRLWRERNPANQAQVIELLADFCRSLFA